MLVYKQGSPLSATQTSGQSHANVKVAYWDSKTTIQAQQYHHANI